jgi:ATP-binding cassette subfamily F protein uup
VHPRREIDPDNNEVRHADGLCLASFDQDRDKLDLDQPLRHALSLQPEPARSALHRLSGGERAHVHIARLMLQPADVLLFDEPTNDLDIRSARCNCVRVTV